ncbi:AAA family ATPase [Mycolicibacter nonchromogenicus]|uniref:AAA family ATPase n=1 Tax=Mycolicibacter nonchromogenicus TaxID=1782 RepID=A0A1X1Z1E7_MYCNO|nr:AAA family ATPase [Mycolicibacter nonchromogenicus]ORW17061.1 AAA family ATPase [Mycolicibacter nonchromogenicus]
MSDVEVGTFAREAAPRIEAIGRRLIDCGLGKDDSLLTPGEPVWSVQNLEQLKREYVDKPDMGPGDFFDKLKHQLAQTSPAATQLFAEVLILNVLPILNMGGLLKVKQIKNVLDMSSLPVAIPADVEEALLGGGVFHGGQAFTSYKWAQIGYLIEVARHFKALPDDRRADALADPLIFRDEIDTVPTGQAAQRQSLLYLAFPHFFLPVVSNAHRTTMRDGLAADYLDSPSGDVDIDLARIYEALVDAEGGHVDLYSPEWKAKWEKGTPPKPEPTPDVQHAWKVHGSNVKGQDMIPVWREKQSLSLAASLLRPVDPDVTREELKAFVDEDYRSSGYAARQEKFDEFYAFLKRMHPGDLVVTISQGDVHFGTITGDPYFVTSSDGRSNLRRSVKWYQHPCRVADLPGDVAVRLNAQGEVLDLSQHLETLTALAERRPPRPTHGDVHLPDATAELAQQLHVGINWLQDCVELLRDRRQLIFYGPPGTGKTYIAQKLARHITDEANIKFVQFHPAYSYEDFFEGFRPQGEAGGQIGFTLKAGPLRSLVDKAVDNPDAVFVLIIDEINRGNLPKIFGELYFLLEYRDQAIDLMYSSDSAEPFSLPKNIYVIGTMNTADRSIALVDAALRRRFAFLPLHPSEAPTNGILRSWLAAKGFPMTLADLHDELNNRISDSDFKIGPSYFMRDRLAGDLTGAALKLMWRTDILPLLEEHHYGERTVDVHSRYGLDALTKSLASTAAATDGDGLGLDTEPGDDESSTADPY